MNFFGDVSLLIGGIGVIIYICLITIRHTSRSAKVKVAIKHYDEQIERMRQRLGELREKRDAMDPDVDRLVNRMIQLREARDKLQFRHEEMVARSRERDINIKFSAH